MAVPARACRLGVAPRALLFCSRNTPSSRIVAPAYVLAPLSVSVPAPDFVSAPAPEIAPEISSPVAESTRTAAAAGSETFPDQVLLPEMLCSAPPWEMPSPLRLRRRLIVALLDNSIAAPAAVTA